MNMEIGERLVQLIKNKGVTAYMVADETGISQSTLSRIINKNAKPSKVTLQSIVDYFNITQDWFLTGKGEIHQTDIEKLTESLDRYAAEIEAMKEKLELKNKIIEGLEFKVETLEERIARIKAANKVD